MASDVTETETNVNEGTTREELLQQAEPLLQSFADGHFTIDNMRDLADKMQLINNYQPLVVSLEYTTMKTKASTFD